MKRFYSLRWLLVLFLLASLPALACGLTDGGDDGTPEPAGETADEVEESAELPEESPESGPPAEAPEFPDLEDMNTNLEGFDSYRLDITLSYEGTEGVEIRGGVMRIQTSQVTEPRASEVVVTLEGDLPDQMMGAETLTFTEIGDQSYTVFPGLGCLAGTADEQGGTADEFSGVIETEDVLGEIQDAEYLGEETIDGVATYHYRFDESHAEQEEGLDDMEGHVYISQELGYVVRMIVDGTGKIDLFDTGEMEDSAIHMEYNVTDVNAPFVIEPPAECADAGSDYPVMEGATELASMMGFTSYKIEAPLDDVIAFYEAEMAALGYDADEEQMIFEDTAILGYSLDGGRVNVTVTEDAGIVSVLITGDSGEE